MQKQTLPLNHVSEKPAIMIECATRIRETREQRLLSSSGWQMDHLRLRNWITCDSWSLATPRVHLRLGFWITCTFKLPLGSDLIHHGWGGGGLEAFCSQQPFRVYWGGGGNILLTSSALRPYAHSSHLGFIGVGGGTFYYLHHLLWGLMLTAAIQGLLG